MVRCSQTLVYIVCYAKDTIPTVKQAGVDTATFSALPIITHIVLISETGASLLYLCGILKNVDERD